MRLTLPTELVKQIEQILADLRREAEAECALLADISGQLISVEGQIRGVDPVLVAALAAGDVAAMAELTRLIGEDSLYGSFLHEGECKSIYLFTNICTNCIPNLRYLCRNRIPNFCSLSANCVPNLT